MSYVLKNDQEAQRLHQQSESINYNVKTELKAIAIEDGAKVLEIGCGAGSLISYLNNEYDITAHACDLQDEHVKFCQDKYAGSGIKFFSHDILSHKLNEQYDYIFIRFVAHHLGVKKFSLATPNLKKTLAPNGKLIIIDVDGLMENIGTINTRLEKALEKIQHNFEGDLRMGRKIPLILNEYGFNNINYEIQTIEFNKKLRAEEVNQWKKRFHFAQDAFIEILGTELEFAQFKKDFFAAINNPLAPFFMNKIITTASI